MLRRLLICMALLITSISVVWFNQITGETYTSNPSEFFLQLFLVAIRALTYSSVLYLFVRELAGKIKNKGFLSLFFAIAFLISIIFKTTSLDILTQEDKYIVALREIVSGKSLEKSSHESYGKDVYGDFAPALNLTKSAMEYPGKEIELFSAKLVSSGYQSFLTYENISNYHYLMGSFGKIEDILSSIDPLKNRIRSKLTELEIQAKILEINNQGFNEELFTALKKGNEQRMKFSEQTLDLYKSILLQIKDLLSFLSNIYGSYGLEDEQLVFSDEAKMHRYNDSINKISALSDELIDLHQAATDADAQLVLSPYRQ